MSDNSILSGFEQSTTTAKLPPQSLHFCHVVTGLLGGPEVIVRQLMNMQMAAGHRVSLVFSTVHGGDENVVRKLPKNIELIRWDAGREINPASDYRHCRELIGILRRLEPDVVHLHNSKAGALGRIACRVIGLRNVYSPHGPGYLRDDIGSITRLFYFSIEWLLSLFGDQLVASSPSELRSIRYLSGQKHLICNGVDPEAVAAVASDSPLVPHSGRFRIVICSRIWAQKNPALVAKLAAASPAEWEWIWIGDGSLRHVAESTGRVMVLGWQDPANTLAMVRTADAYLQASLWEGMSYALLEAMALAKPCVVSNVTGNRDVVRTGVSGYVCDTEAQYLAGLREVAVDVALRSRLGAGARASIESEFNLRHIAEQWRRLYLALVPGAKSRQTAA